MADPESSDAANFARLHAGEHEAGLTPAQRELLGRVIAKRIERGAKLDAIARAAATALFDLDPRYARRLGRDETLRAFAHESLQMLRASGAADVVLSPAHDACPACVAAGGTYPVAAAPAIPVPGCTHHLGCRCRYMSAAEAASSAPGANALADAGNSGPAGAAAASAPDPAVPRDRPWYRAHPPRPHGPRWTDEEREARHGTRPPQPTRVPRPAPGSAPPSPPSPSAPPRRPASAKPAPPRRPRRPPPPARGPR